MATAWQTLEEAALTLGISSRTLHRRLARGEFETRLENGRREVLVVIPDPTPFPELKLTPDAPPSFSMADTSAAPLPRGATATAVTAPPIAPPVASTDEAPQPSATECEDEATPSDAGEDVGQAMLTLHEDRIRRTDLAIMAYQQSVNVTAADARRAQRRSKVAWGVTGGLTVAAFVSAIWATHTVTRARGEVEHLGQVVRQLTDTADTRSAEVERLRQDAETARVNAARVEGQLEAARVQIDRLQASAQVARNAAQALPAGYSAADPDGATTQPATAATTQPVSGLNATIERVTLK